MLPLCCRSEAMRDALIRGKLMDWPQNWQPLFLTILGVSPSVVLYWHEWRKGKQDSLQYAVSHRLAADNAWSLCLKEKITFVSEPFAPFFSNVHQSLIHETFFTSYPYPKHELFNYFICLNSIAGLFLAGAIERRHLPLFMDHFCRCRDRFSGFLDGSSCPPLFRLFGEMAD